MCQHQPPCPPAGAPDRQAARVVASHPEQGWSLLCNDVVAFEDTGVLLPGGQSIPPHQPALPHGDRPSAPAGDRLRRSSGPCTCDAPGQRSLANRLAATGGAGSHAQAVTTSSCGEHPAPSRETKVRSSGSGRRASQADAAEPRPAGIMGHQPSVAVPME